MRMTFGQDGLPPLGICQEYACRDKLSPDPRQGPRLSIRIDIWILPSDTVYYSRIGRRQCIYLPLVLVHTTTIELAAADAAGFAGAAAI